MFLVLILFVLAILIMSLVGYASYISGAQAPTRWRRIFTGLTFGLVGLCFLVFTLAVVIVFPAMGSFLTWPASNPLIGEWRCVEEGQDCLQQLHTAVGSGVWALDATLTFAKVGRLTSGNRSLFLRDGVITSGGMTCEYDWLDERHMRVDCGFGTRDFEYELDEDRLTILWESPGSLPGKTRIYQRAKP